MTKPTPASRALILEDRDAYVALRAEMLREAPASFLSAPGDDRFEKPGAYEQHAADPAREIFAAFHDDRLAAVAGVARNTRPKIAHFAEIWGVYTTPAARGKGLGRACMSAAIDWAGAGGAHAVRLSVSAGAPAARAMYESLGFAAWGTEPDSMLVDGRMIDEVYMQLKL